MESNQMGTTVALPGCVVHNRVNQRWQYSGIDSLNHCLDKQYFLSYPYPVEYVYNSRGFRDSEWPKSDIKLKESVWCVGDSFTVGIGQSFDHIWPQVLSKQINRRCINVSMDGASNDWIARQAKQIIYEISPRHLVVHWSFVHRREESTDKNLQAVKSTPEQDLENFCKNFYLLNDLADCTKIINSVIPNAWPGTDRYEVSGWWWQDKKLNPNIDWPEDLPQVWENVPLGVKKFLEQQDVFRFQNYAGHFNMCNFVQKHKIILTKQQDLARDGFHYDIVTANSLVSDISNQI